VLEDFEDIEAVFINGARQSGKSTFAAEFEKRLQTVNVTFDDVSARAAENASPGQIFADIKEGLVILDEIQYVPQTFLALKAKIDEGRRKKQKVKFLLTGSADIMLLPRLADALVGRMYIKTLYPFSAAEIFDKPGHFVRALFKNPPDVTKVFPRQDIFKVIAKASFPKLSLEIKNKTQWFQNYISTLIDRDVKMFSEADKTESFPQLLSILANRTGGLLNDADLAGAIKLSQPTIKRYRALLNGVFLTFMLQPWHKNIEKRLIKSPKIYFTDTTLLCHLLGCQPGEIKSKRPDMYDSVLENFVAAEIRKELSLMTGYGLYFLRTSDQKEIDFLIEAPDGKILAVEVKASAYVGPEDFKHIAFFKTAAGGALARGIVLYQGEKIIRFEEDLYAVPFPALWEM
jgi:predicted AAA+ superfamily ATPase